MSVDTRQRKKSPASEATTPEPMSVLTSPRGENGHDHSGKDSIWREWKSASLLVLLYALQGVPLGISTGSIPFMLQESTSYTLLGVFSLCSYPYSLKLLWSPIVDAFFWRSIGRRKSWVVPAQLIIGLSMILYSSRVEAWIKHGDVYILTALMFLLIFFVATQDIAVDGWALTMLSPANRGYGSTCQAVGMNIGYFLSYTIFLALSSAKFCNSYLRSTPSDVGLLTLSEFMFGAGCIYLVVTVAVAFGKAEAPEVDADGQLTGDHGLKHAYRLMWRITALPSIRSLTLVLLTSKIPFSVADSVLALKLIEKGFPKENLALMVFITFPFEIAYPMIIGHRMGTTPLHQFLLGYPFRLVMTLLGTLFVWSLTGAEISFWSYVTVVIFQLIYSFSMNLMFVSMCGFFSLVSDPTIGGTYMTLLNTITNLGGAWPRFFVFYLVDKLSCKEPRHAPDTPALPFDPSTCWVPAGTDGFYIVSAISACLGVAWYISFRDRVLALQAIPRSAWAIDSGRVSSPLANMQSLT